MSEQRTIDPPDAPGPGAEQLAQLFHDIYERRAPEFGYTTRTDTRRFDRGSHNGKLMIAVCDDILTWLDLKVTADEIARLTRELSNVGIVLGHQEILAERDGLRAALHRILDELRAMRADTLHPGIEAIAREALAREPTAVTPARPLAWYRPVEGSPPILAWGDWPPPEPDDTAWLPLYGSVYPDQLPEGMKHCTIQFKECEKGHGWLTAANWVQHGCPTCERDRLRAALENILAEAVPIGYDAGHHAIEQFARAALSGQPIDLRAHPSLCRNPNPGGGYCPDCGQVHSAVPVARADAEALAAVPELKGKKAVVLYFETEADRDELVAAIHEAKPGMRAVNL